MKVKKKNYKLNKSKKCNLKFYIKLSKVKKKYNK